MTRKREFALYKGENFIRFGTKKQLAEFLGVKERTICFYRPPTYVSRTEGRGLVVVDITGWDKDER